MTGKLRIFVDGQLVDVALPLNSAGDHIIPSKGDEIKYLGASYEVVRRVWIYDLDETSVVVFAS